MNDLLTVSVDFSETDKSVMTISRQTEDGEIRIVNTLTGSVAESIYIKLMSEADFQKLLEDCDVNQYIYALYFRYF